jgi:uncharacterized membrane protein
LRAGYLDTLRGIAVLWMIIFHTAYDLRILGFVNWNFTSGFWFAFPRVIAFTFLFCVGLSLNYVHTPQINWRNLQKRSLKLALAALIISSSTYLIFPDNWIFFGTLHSILLGSVLGALLVNRRQLAWIIFGLLIILQYGLDYDIKWVSSIIRKPSMDFIPIYPWFWSILLGILSGPYLSKFRQLTDHSTPKLLRFFGKHSLVIYLIHQPIIFGTLWVIKSTM